MAGNRYPYTMDPRFVTPTGSGQIASPYDEDSRLFQDLQQRGLQPVFVTTLSLATAGSLSIPITGYHFVLYGHDGSSIKTVNTTAYAGVSINTTTSVPNPYPAKHARGFSGPFNGLHVQWPAQAGVYADLVVYKSAERPWIDGESAT